MKTGLRMKKGLRLLSLGMKMTPNVCLRPLLTDLNTDGGGIRGLSELIIIQDLMAQLQERLSLPQTPKPAEYFDLIGGTSTGG